MYINQYSTHQHEFRTDEALLCRAVINMTENQAIKEIERRYCLAFVAERDRSIFEPTTKTAHSYRVNLVVKRGKVVSAFIG